LENYTSENLLVIKDFNSKSFYLVLNDREKSLYYLYKYNTKNLNFIKLNQIESNFTYSSDRGNFSIGYLKSSISGKYLVSCITGVGLELLKFNRTKETLEVIYQMNGSDETVVSNYYSAEFSPNEKYLYYFVSNWNMISVNRIILEDKSIESNIAQFESSKYSGGNLLLGPNFKIYISLKESNYLYSIEQPDSLDIKFKTNSVLLENLNKHLSFPNIPITYYNRLSTKDTLLVCESDSIFLSSKLYASFRDTIYSWTGPNNFSSNSPNPIISNATKSNEGYYYLTVFNRDSSIRFERKTYLKVISNTIPKITVSPDTIICNSNFAELSVPSDYNEFEWTTGETTHTITVVESGVYGVTYSNENGCTGYAEVNITFEEDMTTDILGETEICEGSSTTLSANQDYETYLWSNGDDTKTTLISEAGTYWLEVTTAEGCTISDTIDISYHPNLIAELKPAPTTICEGDSVLLESKYDAPYFDYLWSTNETTKSIYASETGTYKLKITDTRTGCMDSTEIAISVEDNLQPTIIGTNICEGETATLEVLPNDPSYSYEWSNGETTPTIEVSQPATYTVTVSKDGCSGTAEFTVNESPNPEFEILGEDIVCGNSATLSPNKDFTDYLWSTDEVTKEIEVTEPGTYSLTVTDENGCSATKEFTVNEQSLSFKISKDRIDFGKVYISETTIDSAEIINTSGFDITIQSGDEQYRILDGQTVQYNKTLNPTELGPYTDSFEYRVIEPCDTVITIPVTAEVYARVEFSTKEETETKIGDEVSIPVYLQAEADLSEQTYTITTDIDKTVLFTENDYTFTQTAPINKAKTQIHEISGMIMLASELEYEITFPSYEFNNPYIEVTTESGTIKIDSVCAFPQRSITFTESTEMKVSPNPARDRLVVVVTTGHFDKLNDQSNKSVAEPVEASGQQMQLELISAEGRVAYTENWAQTASEKQVIINTNKIPSGLYQVRLQTPSGVLTENVIVVR
jgi:hypothetical protein